MIIHKGYENLDLRNPVVTLGIFDGVHRGHRALLDILISRAKEVKGKSVVLTFHPHPRMILDKNIEGLSFLSTMEEKTDLLEKANVDHLVIIEFTPEFSRIGACDFVKDILVKKIRTQHLIIGYDHHFGHRGEGDFETIKKCAVSMGFVVEKVNGLMTDDGAISSSLIRKALLNGRVDKAALWLGYKYSIKGSVVEGRKIGRIIGFPTANIQLSDQFKLVPSDGVYAVEVEVDNKRKKGMLSIGKNPTVNKEEDKKFIEVNIFDFEGDIYGKDIEIIFHQRLRSEIKFETIDQLIRQMELDKAESLRLLG